MVLPFLVSGSSFASGERRFPCLARAAYVMITPVKAKSASGKLRIHYNEQRHGRRVHEYVNAATQAGGISLCYTNRIEHDVSLDRVSVLMERYLPRQHVALTAYSWFVSGLTSLDRNASRQRMCELDLWSSFWTKPR